MKFPTVILVSLIICSVVRPAPALFGLGKKPTAVAPNTTSQGSSVEAAKKAVSPSIFQKTKALMTGKPQPADKPLADIKGTKSMAVNTPDKKLFTVDGNKKLGAGAYGAVYDAKNHSSPNTPTVMKISKTPGSLTRNPSLLTRNEGEPNKDFKNRAKATTAGAAAFDQAHAQAAVNRENGFNKRMGLSAGKPVAVADGHQTMTAMPMKKVEGAPLYKELQKGRADPSYISSHKLLYNAKNAIDEANNKGIQHNDAHSENILVTKTGGKLIDYGLATNRKGNADPLTDHKRLIKDLKTVRPEVPLSRLDSFDHAMKTYDNQIKNPLGSAGRARTTLADLLKNTPKL